MDDKFIRKFSTDTNTYEITIKKIIIRDELSSVFVKIGGKTYSDCVTISYKFIDGKPSSASIPWFSSEPECSIHYLLEKGITHNTVKMIKASLQYVYLLMPEIHIFKFDDMSNIDCDSLFTKKITTHIPFSLSHLSIALYGQTWYEKYFNAKMVDEVQYAKYRNAVKILEGPKMPYKKFIDMNDITEKQDEILNLYYESTYSWDDFFNAIPKKDRCFAFFNWLFKFIDTILNDTFISKNWIIDVNTMAHIKIYQGNIHLDTHNKKTGGTRSNKLKISKNTIKFSNDWFMKHSPINLKT